MPLTDQEELELLELEKQEALTKSKPQTQMREVPYWESALRGAGQGLSLGWEDEIRAGVMAPFSDKNYAQIRDEIRAKNLEAKSANPKTFLAGEAAGGVATTAIPGLNVAKGASLATALGKGALIGGSYGLGSSEAEDTASQVKDAVKGTAVGLVGGGLTHGLANLGKLGSALKGKSEKLAETATGATRVQAEKFAEGSGRELLDRGLVKFGDAPADIAKRASKAMDASNLQLDDALSALDDAGVKIEPSKVLAAIDQRIQQLKNSGAGNASQRRALETIKADVAESIGNKASPLSKLELEKRSFGKVNWMDPDQALAKKSAYRGLMDLVEKEATAANPELASKFVDAKKTYGLLNPIQEAAEKRALQLQQQPVFGLKDMVASTVGAITGGTGGAVAMPVARRILEPRMASMGAVTLDKLSKAIKPGEKVLGAVGNITAPIPLVGSRVTVPNITSKAASLPNTQDYEGIAKQPQTSNKDRVLEKVAGTPFEGVLKEAMAKGEDAFGVAYYQLSQQFPEFTKLLTGGDEAN